MPRAAPRVVNNRDEDDDDEVESSASESEAEEEDLAAEDEAEDVGHDADEEEGEEQEEQEREEPRGGRAGGADGPASASGRGGVKQGGGRLKLSLAAGNDVCKVRDCGGFVRRCACGVLCEVAVRRLGLAAVAPELWETWTRPLRVKRCTPRSPSPHRLASLPPCPLQHASLHDHYSAPPCPRSPKSLFTHAQHILSTAHIP